MESEFTGGLFGLVGINILATALTIFKLGIALPFAVCLKQRWVADHTILDGHRLMFDGTGFQLFGQYIKCFLLTIITLGIYAFWLGIKMKKWVVSHTHVA